MLLSLWLPFTPMALLASKGALTTIVSPEIATTYPNRSFAPVFEALRYACWLQFVPRRTKTYAAPESVALLLAWFPLIPIALLSSCSAPTTMGSPDTATGPNTSFAPVLEALRYACCAGDCPHKADDTVRIATGTMANVAKSFVIIK